MSDIILFCGSRTFTNEQAIRQVVERLPAAAIVIHGGAKGADSIAGRLAEECGFEVREFPAQWSRYGRRRAGPLRNQVMLEQHPTWVYAFVDKPLRESKGTLDMVTRARQAGIGTNVVERRVRR